MRVYHFLSEHWALEALKLRRLKLSLLEEMNDPFELLGIALKKASDRKAFRKLKAEMNRTIGVLCFSRGWNNPVLWSHYGDRHGGICLGFDIPYELAKEVTYRGTLLEPELEQALPIDDHDTLGYKLITTKYEHWRYEDEVRMIVRLEHAQSEADFHFLPFCAALRLKEIITGPRCTLTRNHLRAAVSKQDPGVAITKGRLAFQSYKVVRNKAAE